MKQVKRLTKKKIGFTSDEKFVLDGSYEVSDNEEEIIPLYVDTDDYSDDESEGYA